MLFSTVLSLLTLCSLVVAVPTSTDGSENQPRLFSGHRAGTGRDLSQMTNAQRLARGLPPNPPVRRDASLGHSRRTASQTPQTSYHGVIQVVSTLNSALLGYISGSSLTGAQYRYQPTIATALIVDFNINAGVTSADKVRMTAENGETGFPILALIQGQSDTNTNLGALSFEYVYVGGSSGSSPGSTPSNVANSYTSSTGISRASESDVWSIDLNSGIIVPKWVNTDNSLVSLQCWAQSTNLYCGGSEASYISRFGASVTDVTFIFVPA
ncbi:hypothetical protein BDN72DRAFT_395134 [Pluteus cervinus]|uniref:Uncharacterized protein n=1 Tax=Pluteus cervinus TaxID=181527 RepID=A0ACD3B1X9_9AGAR|nr:hypothetical protein BDN72DRAFT_395134 [Pluteus cervinus]